jgi:translation initiation factor eIF-2B subunit delta
VGLNFISNVALGSNTKCIKMLTAFKEVVNDYMVPSDRAFRTELDSVIRTHEAFLYLLH